MIDILMSEQWSVLRSKPRKERALARYARSENHEVFFPTIPIEPINPRSSRVRPYFPGYMFVYANLNRVGESTFHWMPLSQGLVHLSGGERSRILLRMIHDRYVPVLVGTRLIDKADGYIDPRS